MSTSEKDYLQRLLFENIDARCVLVRLDRTGAEVLTRGGYPAPVAELLMQTLLVAATLSSGIKFSGRISLQLQSAGPLSLLMADCTDTGGLRAIARLREQAELPPSATELFQALGRKATLTLTVDPSGEGRRWQGIVPVEGHNLAEAIAGYFGLSEQLPTRMRMATDGHRGGALLIQRLPEGSGGDSDDEDGWNRLQHLIATVSDEELLNLEGELLLKRLFHEEERRLFPRRSLEFYCPCSRTRVLEVLHGLGQDELASMAGEAQDVEVRCQFCNQAYVFDPLDLAALAQGGDVPPGDTLH